MLQVVALLKSDSLFYLPSSPPLSEAEAHLAEARKNALRKIKLDILHVMQRYAGGCSSTTDPLFGVFLHLLKLAFYKINTEDLEAVRHWLDKSRHMTIEQIRGLPSNFYDNLVRKEVPLPTELRHRLQALYDVFSKAIGKDGESFFRQRGKDNMADIHTEVLKHVFKGCISDPPGLNMYYEVGAKPGAGMSYHRILHSIRGTSLLENFHLHLRRNVLADTTNVSPEVRFAHRSSAQYYPSS